MPAEEPGMDSPEVDSRADVAWLRYRANDFAGAAEAFASLRGNDAFVEKLRSFAAGAPLRSARAVHN
jgi:hypothetical protein